MKTLIINQDFLKKIKNLSLPEKSKETKWVILHVYGDNVMAPPKFNIKIYKNKKGILKLVTNDYETLVRLLKNRKSEKKERTVSIDDSGWGFAIGGVLIGAYDTLTKKTKIKEVNVKFFKEPLFSQKAYLDEYAKQGLELVKEFNIDKEKTIIKICPGYINIKLKERLREEGYSVEVAEIKEPLQSELERRHKDYVKSLGYDEYYDPKELNNNEIVSRFNKSIEWLKANNKMHLAKSGWKYFRSKTGNKKSL